MDKRLYRVVGSNCFNRKTWKPLISKINSVDLSADKTALQPSSDEILELEKKCEDIHKLFMVKS